MLKMQISVILISSVSPAWCCKSPQDSSWCWDSDAGVPFLHVPFVCILHEGGSVSSAFLSDNATNWDKRGEMEERNIYSPSSQQKLAAVKLRPRRHM